jgi:hypothetical protein
VPEDGTLRNVLVPAIVGAAVPLKVKVPREEQLRNALLLKLATELPMVTEARRVQPEIA